MKTRAQVLVGFKKPLEAREFEIAPPATLQSSDAVLIVRRTL